MSRWVVVKGVLGGAGFTVGLTGMVLGSRPVVWVAVALLGAAFLVRFVERREREASLSGDE
jgi:hypothetical protein